MKMHVASLLQADLAENTPATVWCSHCGQLLTSSAIIGEASTLTSAEGNMGGRPMSMESKLTTGPMHNTICTCGLSVTWYLAEMDGLRILYVLNHDIGGGRDQDEEVTPPSDAVPA